MPETQTTPPLSNTVTNTAPGNPCRLAVIWIDWYAYHVARFRGLLEHPMLAGSVVGIELVGGVGVHAGLKFREELPADLPVQTLFPQGNWRETSHLKLARALWRKLSELNPEVVLVPGYYTLPGIAAALWAKLHRRRSVLMTESTRDDHQRSAWKERLKSLLIRSLFDWAIAGGAPHRGYLQQLGFPLSRVAGSYDVVDNRGFREKTQTVRAQQTPAALGLPEDFFLYVGRLSPEKNIDGLLRAFIDYRRQGGLWSLVLVGDGPSAAALRLQVADAGLDHAVLFAGLRGSAELPSFYAFARAFVLPSTTEPWGLVVNEAMASGLPVVVSNRCGCAEDLVLSGKTGLVFDAARPDELLSCLRLMESLSPEKRAWMSAEALERIQNYSPATFAAEVARIVKAS